MKAKMLVKVDAAKIDVSIKMITTYVKDVDVSMVIGVLEMMKKNPDDVSLIDHLSDALQLLGVAQGAVLTYAPYLAVLVSDDSFKDC